MRENIIREIFGTLNICCTSPDIDSPLKLEIKESGDEKLLVIYLSTKEARKMVKDISTELTRRRLLTPKHRKYKVRSR